MIIVAANVRLDLLDSIEEICTVIVAASVRRALIDTTEEICIVIVAASVCRDGKPEDEDRQD